MKRGGFTGFLAVSALLVVPSAGCELKRDVSHSLDSVSPDGTSADLLVGPDSKIPVEGGRNDGAPQGPRVETLAGTGTQGWRDGDPLKALFNSPKGLVVDNKDNLYVADSGNHRIRKIDLNTGQVSTLAGNGKEECSQGPVAATNAGFKMPHDVTVGSGGNVIYVANTLCHQIAVISKGVVAIHAGTGAVGYKDDAREYAQFNRPSGVALDSAGKVYVADHDNHRIRMIDSVNVSTVAGTGKDGYVDGEAVNKAEMRGPSSVAVTPGGALLFADSSNHLIREYNNGTVATKAGFRTAVPWANWGFRDGLLDQAKFALPMHLALGKTGAVYVGDWGNHLIRVIKNGRVDTYAGKKDENEAKNRKGDDDGPVFEARFNNPWGVAVDSKGRVYVADSSNHVIRVIIP